MNEDLKRGRCAVCKKHIMARPEKDGSFIHPTCKLIQKKESNLDKTITILSQ